jgi:hypothetical protein
MSNINDIFDLPEGQQQSPKKERKKIVMSDDKKVAMLERLAKGRETRANNLLVKKGQKVENLSKEQTKEPVKEIKVDKSEEERKAFINTMVGKSKPVEKFERPKKKVITESLEAPKIEAVKIEAPKIEAPKIVAVPKIEVPKVVAAPKIEAPKVVAPVVFSTFKRPMWG